MHFRRVRSGLGEGQLVRRCCAEKERAREWSDASEGVNGKREEGHVASEEVADDAVAVDFGAPFLEEFTTRFTLLAYFSG